MLLSELIVELGFDPACQSTESTSEHSSIIALLWINGHRHLYFQYFDTLPTFGCFLRGAKESMRRRTGKNTEIYCRAVYFTLCDVENISAVSLHMLP
jgi:hypothetical protein